MYIGCIQKVSLKKYDKCELQLKCEGISEFYKGMSITRTQSMWSFKQWSNEICIQLNHRVFPHLQKFSGSPLSTMSTTSIGGLDSKLKKHAKPISPTKQKITNTFWLRGGISWDRPLTSCVGFMRLFHKKIFPLGRSIGLQTWRKHVHKAYAISQYNSKWSSLITASTHAASIY